MHRLFFSVLIATLSLLSVSAQQTPATHSASPQSFSEIVVLGSGTPNPDPDHSGLAFAVIVNGRSYLVDCGPGVVRRAAAASHHR